jgi:hypothetical protein
MKTVQIQALFQKEASIKTVVKLDSHTINRLISLFFTGEEFKGGYEIEAYEELGRESKEFDKIGPIEDELDDWDQAIVNKALEGKWEMYSTEFYLDFMCSNGAIPAGDYIIDNR